LLSDPLKKKLRKKAKRRQLATAIARHGHHAGETTR
jgi:hypothetical protein